MVSRNKYGRVIFNNQDLEAHEKKTVFYLSRFGFDVETLTPSNVPKSKNPDLLMLGTMWEMKGPRVYNEATIQTKFRKALKQSGGRAVFDLRNLRDNSDKTEKYIMRLFRLTRGMKRIIIIRKSGRLLDIFK